MPFAAPEYERMSDTERALVEQWSFNHHQTTGQRMKVPPPLWEILSAAGVRMDWMEADESLMMPPENIAPPVPANQQVAFKNHGCDRCENGKLPCVSGHPHNCAYPYEIRKLII